MSPRRVVICAGGLLVGGLLGLGQRAAAQLRHPPFRAQRTDCPGRPEYDFSRVTSDSEQVRVLSGAPADLEAALHVSRHVPMSREDYDVVLDVPRLCIDSLRLIVDSLTARVSVDANVAGLVHVVAGAGVAIDHVDLTLEHIRATALLAVDLSTVARVVNETMDYLDRNPELLKEILAARIRQDRRQSR